MVLNGSDYIVFINTITSLDAERGEEEYYKPIMCGKTNGFNIDIETIALDNKCDGGWKNSVGGYGSWGMSFDGYAVSVKFSERNLKASFNEVGRLALSKANFWIKISDLEGSVVREGIARISSYTESMNMDEPFSFNITFTGIGKPILEATLYNAVLGKNAVDEIAIQAKENTLIKV